MSEEDSPAVCKTSGAQSDKRDVPAFTTHPNRIQVETRRDPGFGGSGSFKTQAPKPELGNQRKQVAVRLF